MSIISAGTSSSTAIKATGNTDGTLVLKTNDTGSGGTTALTLATNQAATFASSVSATTVSASTAVVQGGAAANYAGNFRDATVGGSCYLQITTNASGSANTDGFVWGLDTASPPNAYLSQKENANLYLQANSATVATLTGGGNLGVGVTSPISKLAVATASNTSDLGATGLTIGGATTLTSGNVLMLNFTPIGADSNRARAGIGCEVGADWGKGNLTFYTRDASNSSAMTTADERMRIDSNGYVGIGTTSPLQKVQIAAPSSSGNISPALAFSQGGSGSGTGTSLWLGYGAENTKSVAISGFYDGAGMTMAFYTTPTAASTAFSERMRLTSAGDLLLGTTTGGIGGGLTIVSTKYIYSLGTYNNTTASAANMFVDAAAGVFARSTSALKYKQDIRDLEEIDIGKFRPVRYRSKCENDDQTKDHIGIVADEVHDAGITELVNYGADGEIEGFQYERLTVVLLKAVQTLNAKVAALESKNAQV